MGDTEISWTHRPGTVGRTWNPVQGCRRISPGCEHCYAERLAARFAENGWSKGLINLRTRKWNGKARLADHKLTEPLRWRQPATVFVNSMSDLFYDGFTNEQIAAVFGVMAAAPQHTFQVLTKRARRMRDWFTWMLNALPLRDSSFEPRPIACWDFARKFIRETGAAIDSSVWNCEMMDRAHTIPWPLPNVWLGTSVENQEAADERIPELLATPAAIRFLSCEPLIGPVDLTRIGAYGAEPLSALEEIVGFLERPAVDWIIAGCESGPGARDCDVGWLRSLRDQCEAARVPFFLKQAVELMTTRAVYPSAQAARVTTVHVTGGEGSKHKAGRVIELPYLDGVQHCSFPEVSK